MNTTKLGILSFLNTMSAVFLVANDTLEDKPLVTRLIGKDGPKTDLMGNEIGSIRLEQHSSNLNSGYLNSRKRVAFIAGTYEDLLMRVQKFGLKEGSELPGKIIIIESLEPMWAGQTSKINPETKELIGVRNGDELIPVYMQQRYTEDENAKDKLIRTMEDVIAWHSAREVLKINAQPSKIKEAAAIPMAE